MLQLIDGNFLFADSFFLLHIPTPIPAAMSNPRPPSTGMHCGGQPGQFGQQGSQPGSEKGPPGPAAV